MKLTTLVAATTAGGRLFAAVDPRQPPGRLGALAYSGQIAALAPFASREGAEEAIMRLGIDPSAIAER